VWLADEARVRFVMGFKRLAWAGSRPAGSTLMTSCEQAIADLLLLARSGHVWIAATFCCSLG
jgi:hypothetical protein